MLNKKRFGLSKVVYEIEGLIVNSRYLKNRLYLGYLTLPEWNKQKFREAIERIIKKEILNIEFRRALANDIISRSVDEKGEEIRAYDIKSNIFKYLKSNLYKGDSRQLLIDLESAIQGKEVKS